MQKLVQAGCLLAALSGIGSAQTFEVATVKVGQAPVGEKRNGPNIEATPGHLTMRNVGMGTMIMWAYKISPAQVSNAQVVAGPDFYDVSAKAAGPAKTDEMRVMLQALLAERFKMKTHRETKELSAYALIEAKGGHKLKESALDDGPGVLPVQGGKMALGGKSATMDQLCMFLSGPLRTVVVDKTDLKGRYDFEFDLTNFVGPGAPPPAPGEPPPDPVAILQMALPRQLGLKLEARKMPIEMLVIDHVEKTPVEN